MAAEVAAAYVSLMPSARDFGRRLESEVGGQVDQAGSTLGKRMGRGLAKAAAAAAASVGAVAVAAGTVGVKTAAQLEQAQIAFTTMLGSGEKAQSFLEELSGFAAKTPFEFPELQTAASSLVSVGISADKVIPIMTSLGNATSGMGTGSEGIQRATVALQQMNAAGRITGEDLNQLRDAGIPVFDLLSAATGKSVEQVAALAQAGKLGKAELEQLMGALESGAGLERFTGLMEQQSASLNGMWSTLKDTFSMGMAEAIQPLVPLLKDGLGGATAFVAAQMPTLRAGMERFLEVAREVWAALSSGDAGGALRDAFGADVGASVFSVGDSLQRLAPVVSQLLAQLPSFADVVTVGATALAFLADNADTLTKYMPLVVGAIIAYKVAQLAANVVAAASPLFRLADMAATRAQTQALRQLVAVQKAEAASKGLATTATVANTTATNVGTASTVRSRIATLAASAAAKVAAVGTALVTAAQWAWNAALTANPIGIVIVAIGALVAGLIIAYKKSDSFRAVVDKVWAALKVAGGWVADLGGKVKEWVIDKFEAAKRGLDIWVEAFKKFKLPAWVQTVADLVGGIANGLKTGAGKLASFFGMGDGPGRAGSKRPVGGNTLRKVQSILPPGARITSTYRTPAQNRAVGGHPSSYHIDRVNPAVDIAGSRAVMDEVYRRLLSIGPHRELLYKTPGHWDHVHVAHNGGTVTRDWPRMQGWRSDERPARLQVGETVIPRGGAARHVTYELNAHNYGRPLTPADLVAAGRTLAVLAPPDEWS